MILRARVYGLLALCLIVTVANSEQQQEKSLGEIVRDLAPGQSYTTNSGLTFKKYQQGAGERSDSKFEDGVLMAPIKGFQEQSQRFTWKPFSQGGISGFEFRGVYGNGADFAGRDFMSQQRLCEFIIEFPKTPWEEIPAAVRTSLDSFQSTVSTATAP